MPNKSAESDSPAPQKLERLHKVLAFAGIDSRRKCEALIQEGRVEVDGKFVTELGMKVDPDRQEILVDGQRLKFGKRIYYMLNKPPGVLSTNFDPAGRTRVIDMVPQDVRLFTIGRLDRASEGLIVVTNDGELANRLAHPRYEIEKTYRVEVAGHPTSDAISFVRRGVHLADGFVKPVSVLIKRKNKQSTSLEVILDEGKNREIRRIMAKIGHKVLRLKRIAMGPLRLGEIPEGAFRELKSAETKALRDAAFGIGAGKPRKRKTAQSAQRSEPERRANRTKKRTSSSAGPPTKKRTFDKSARRPAKGRNVAEAFAADDDEDDEGRPISELSWSPEGRTAAKKRAPRSGAPKKRFAKKTTRLKGAPKKGGPKKGGPKKKKSTYAKTSGDLSERGGRKSKRGGTRTKFVKNPDKKKPTTNKKKTKRRK
ncbi:MAG: pseudouridine synthase [Blastopirellula sp. JB062]